MNQVQTENLLPAAGAVYPRRPALGRSVDLGVAGPAARPGPDRPALDPPHLSSSVPARLEEPVLSHGGDAHSLIAEPDCPDGGAHNGWETSACRDHAAISGENRWGAAVRGGNDQSAARIGTPAGRRWAVSSWLALLAEVYGNMGQAEAALTAVAEAFAHVDKTGERYYEAELHRLQGELLLVQSPDNQSEAEACFHQAIAIARSQQAKSWELRAATSLARLWQSQNKQDEARKLLAEIYDWFTEGFDTRDLQDAKALLDELA
jgi:tetratricopeptide (TPR) repeat protein